MEFKLKAEDLKREAAGRWGSILRSLAPALDPALQRAGKHVKCPHPSHGGKNDFRLFKDFEESGGGICTCGSYTDGFALLMWINGWDFYTTFRAVARELGFDLEGGNQNPKPQPKFDQAKMEEARRQRAEAEAAENEHLRERLNRTWKASLAASDPKAEPLRLYLARRGLATQQIPNTLRLHPRLAYANENGEIIGYWPALLALVQDLEGRAVTLHRIYLTHDGQKAPVDAPKKLMAYPSDRTLNGSAIRLGPAGAVVGVAEGIETGLAIQQATGLPVWVTINAILMESLEVPESVKMVCIYADKDKSETGRNSAAVLVQRMWQQQRQAAGLLPTMAIPSAGKGIDWLDVFTIGGSKAIPNLTRVQELLRQFPVGRTHATR